MTELDELLQSVEGRAFCGPASERIASARWGLAEMQDIPERSFRCGPLAIHRILLHVQPDDSQSEFIETCESTRHGCSLRQLADIARQLGLGYQAAFREHGAGFITPSVVHFGVDHFAALIRYDSNRYLVEDPTFRNDTWLTREALEAEASGYFLVPPGKLPDGWRRVLDKEALTVWGSGQVAGEDYPPGPCDYTTDVCATCPEKGMAVARVHLLNASLNIVDTPVGYSPPVGPAVPFTVRYNQRDNQFSSTFNYSNFGPITGSGI